MSHRSDIKAAMSKLADGLLDDEESVSAAALADAFDESSDPDEVVAIAADLYRSLLRSIAKDVLSSAAKVRGDQLNIPGMEEPIESVITVRRGEDFGYKRTRKAEAPDLVDDEEIHAENVTAAAIAHKRAQRRNGIILPVMEATGLTTVADVVDYLTRASTP